ncbi:unnamed protein product [Cylicocyclus nassatus]|uniref:Uncharacterized protein n=1 Tax=Cylicocyclus nassatus TaxID=53992 RepID=A0AA36DLH7_CYLNA|nr:unnamed protein product [Cylicocyclus nassatus]
MYAFYLLILTVTPILSYPCTDAPVSETQKDPEYCETLDKARNEDVVNWDVLSAVNSTYESYLKFCCPRVRNANIDDGQWIMRRSEMTFANETADIVDQIAEALNSVYGKSEKVLYVCFVRSFPITVCTEQQGCTTQEIACNYKIVDGDKGCAQWIS